MAAQADTPLIRKRVGQLWNISNRGSPVARSIVAISLPLLEMHPPLGENPEMPVGPYDSALWKSNLGQSTEQSMRGATSDSHCRLGESG